MALKLTFPKLNYEFRGEMIICGEKSFYLYCRFHCCCYSHFTIAVEYEPETVIFAKSDSY